MKKYVKIFIATVLVLFAAFILVANAVETTTGNNTTEVKTLIDEIRKGEPSDAKSAVEKLEEPF